MRLNFVKMHGLGNDFVVFDASPTEGVPHAEALRALAHRHTGIGFDQALVLSKPRSPDTVAFYQIFNADGAEVEQCGNGARCVAALMAHRLGLANTEITLGSPAGLIHARLKSNSIVCVAMGIPNFEPACVPFLAEHAANSYTLTCVGTEIEFGAVSIGNPHAVIRVDAVASAPVDTIGHAVENHPLFPRRTNVEFMEIVSPNHIKLRVYERGVGETLACGTGACGAVAVGQRRGWLEKDVMVDLPGGRLNVEWLGPDQPIWLTGPTAIVYTGYVDL